MPTPRLINAALETVPDRRRSRVLLTVLLAVSLVLALATALAQSAVARASTRLSTPTSIQVRAFSDPSLIARLSGAPAASIPTVLAGAGDTFLVEVTLTKNGDGAAYKTDQTVTFSASGPGQITPSTATIPQGVTRSVFPVSYSAAAADVRVTATVGRGKSALVGTGTAFRVEKVLRWVSGDDPALTTGNVGSDGDGCAVVDATNPMCAKILLPVGATSDLALSLGPCSAADSCRGGGLVTQLIANLRGADGNLYDRSHPATMVILCDKSVCGNAGVPHFTALWSQNATGALATVPACAAKGVIDAELTFCTDYRSSKRDGAGDLHLYVLFLADVRGAI